MDAWIDITWIEYGVRITCDCSLLPYFTSCCFFFAGMWGIDVSRPARVAYISRVCAV